MEAQNEKQEFVRKARIGINPITLEEGQTRFLSIESDKPEVFTKKDGDEIDYVVATDMQSGEQGHFWLAGSLRHNLAELAGTRKTIKGLKIEVTHKGQKTVEIDGEKRKVNQFELFELQ